MLKKFIIMAVILVSIASLATEDLLASNSNKKTETTQIKAIEAKGTSVTFEKMENPGNVAEKFIKEYLDLDNTRGDFDKWFSTAPITSKFRTELKERYRALKLSEKILNGETSEKKLNAKDNALLKKYRGIEYDPLLGSIIIDIRDESVFVLKGIDEKGNIFTLKDKWEEHFTSPSGEKVHQGGQEIKLKMINQNGKWLVDGIVN